MVFKNVVWKEGKYYVSQCLNVDVSSFGETREEALANLDEALELYLEDKKAAKIPEVKEPRIVPLNFRYA
ncbi:type II toxin-antitoxin system HicB family antitoxin [Candidatus Peregrinibacteria bacterium]|nr:type II toxin-antitoxin system HicB family antitoxin [Candidatus Peregrinibacteria bacterium]